MVGLFTAMTWKGVRGLVVVGAQCKAVCVEAGMIALRLEERESFE